MDSIMFQPLRLAGWSPARIPQPIPTLGQTAPPTSSPVPPSALPAAPTPPAVPQKSAVIDSSIFNFFIDGLGAFAMGALAFGAASQKATTAAVVLGIGTGGLAIKALYDISKTAS